MAKSELVLRDGAYTVMASVVRYNGLIRKGLMSKKYISFGLNVKALCRAKINSVKIIADLICKDGSVIRMPLKQGMNYKEISTDKLKSGNLINVYITAVFNLPLFKKKVMKLRVARAM